MRILLPPSESKNAGSADSPISISTLSFPELLDARRKLLNELVKVSKRRDACERLGIPKTLTSQLELNRDIWQAPTSNAIEIYTGVLFDALAYRSLSPTAKVKANQSLVIFSAAFGMLSATDHIPSYRLSASAKLFGNKSLNTYWNRATATTDFADEVLIDLRSGMYSVFWSSNNPEKYLNLKIVDLDKNSGKKLAVSHFNKATKGFIARDLVHTQSRLKTPTDVLNALTAKEWNLGEITFDKFNRMTCEVFMKPISM